jgi:hypothetical protein
LGISSSRLTGKLRIIDEVGVQMLEDRENMGRTLFETELAKRKPALKLMMKMKYEFN